MTQSAQPTTVWLTKTTFDRLTAELEDLAVPSARRSSSGSAPPATRATSRRTAATTRPRTSRARSRPGSASSRRCSRTAETDEPDDDGVVAPGKLVTYRFAGDDEAEKFLLGAREIEDDYEDRTSRCLSRSRRSAPRSSAHARARPSSFEAPTAGPSGSRSSTPSLHRLITTSPRPGTRALRGCPVRVPGSVTRRCGSRARAAGR